MGGKMTFFLSATIAISVFAVLLPAPNIISPTTNRPPLMGATPPSGHARGGSGTQSQICGGCDMDYAGQSVAGHQARGQDRGSIGEFPAGNGAVGSRA
jgi:hypothetical protein